METVYDHNPTKKEIEDLTLLSRDLYERFTADSRYQAIFLLYTHRGQQTKADFYFQKMSQRMQAPYLMQDEIDDSI